MDLNIKFIRKLLSLANTSIDISDGLFTDLDKLINKQKLSYKLYLKDVPISQNLKRLIPFIIKKSLKNEKFPCSDGNQVRDLIFVEDLIKLIKLSLKNNV